MQQVETKCTDFLTVASRAPVLAWLSVLHIGTSNPPTLWGLLASPACFLHTKCQCRNFRNASGALKRCETAQPFKCQSWLQGRVLRAWLFSFNFTSSPVLGEYSAGDNLGWIPGYWGRAISWRFSTADFHGIFIAYKTLWLVFLGGIRGRKAN